MYSAMKLLSEVSFLFAQKNPIIFLELHDKFAKMNYLTSVKIDHPEIAKLCLSSKRDSVFLSVYLQEVSSDLSG